MLDGFPVYRLKARKAEELLQVLSLPGMPSTILLHYVGYGYEKRGCPVWLVTALEAWKKAERRSEALHQAPNSDQQPPNSRHLVTMFHELFASGPPWRSSFWTSPAQRSVARRVAHTSDAVRTNREESARWLDRVRGAGVSPSCVAPVCSNFGESKRQLPLVHREPLLLMIGGRSWIEPLVTSHGSAVNRVCEQLEVEKIVTIGSPTGLCRNLRLPAKELGVLPAVEIGHWLAHSRFGLMRYFPGYIGKSGIFAAYAAHGIVPLLLEPTTDGDEGLIAGQHYLRLGQIQTRCDMQRLQAVAEAALNWYRPHNWAHTAYWYARVL